MKDSSHSLMAQDVDIRSLSKQSYLKSSIKKEKSTNYMPNIHNKDKDIRLNNSSDDSEFQILQNLQFLNKW